MTSRVVSRVASSMPPVLGGVSILVAWELLIRAFNVEAFLLPAPSNIVVAFGEEWQSIVEASWVTIREVLLGLLLGVVFGVLGAYLVSRSERVSAPLLVVATALNCAPIIALAPISNNWFGVTSLISKAAIAGVMVFFPVFVNCTRGFTNVNALHKDLLDSFSATDSEFVRYVRAPNALPFFFSALRLGASLSVIGAIVAEYFGGPTKALGVYIGHEASLTKFDNAWAGIVVATLTGLTLLGVVSLVEKALMPWAKTGS